MSPKTLTSAFNDLKYEQQRHLLTSMEIPDLCALFNSLADDPICDEALAFISRERLKLLFDGLGIQVCAKLMQYLSARRRIDVLYRLEEGKRKELPQFLEQWLLKDITASLHMQEKRFAQAYKRPIIPHRIATGSFLNDYPESAKVCVTCKEAYLIFESVNSADCGLHSFHRRCMSDGICTGCPIPDIFPQGDIDYLKGHSMAELVITGFGHFRLDASAYILIGTPGEEREPYWYSFDMLQKVFPGERLLHKLTKFLLNELAGVYEQSDRDRILQY